MLRFTVFLALFLAAPLWADKERLVHLLTSLPVGPTHVAQISIFDRDSLTVFQGQIAGNLVDIWFPFVASDLDRDGVVSFQDFFIFADQFGQPGPNRADLDRSGGKVDFQDFFIFADQFGLGLGEAAKLAADEVRQFAADLEKNAVRFSANLADPQVIAEIARLRAKLGRDNIVAALFNASLDDVKLYNVLGQSLDRNSFPALGSGMYFAVFGQRNVARFTVFEHRAWFQGSRVCNLGELAERAQPITRGAAKTAVTIAGVSFFINIVSESNAFAPVAFVVQTASLSNPQEIIGTIEELSQGTVAVHTAPQPIAGLPVVEPLPDETALLPLLDLFTVQGSIRSARILAVPDSLTATLDGTTLLVRGLTNGEVRQIVIEVTDSLDLVGVGSVLVRSPVITRALAVNPADTTVAAGTDSLVPARGSLALFYDGELSKTEPVELVLVGRDTMAVDSLSLYEITLRFFHEELEAMQTITILPPPPPPVVDRPPSVRLRLERYQSALGSGRDMEFRIDASDDIALSRNQARVVARRGQDSVVTEVALMQLERTSGYTYGFVIIPGATSLDPSTWTLTGYMADTAGQVGIATLEFQQDGWVAPPPPPPPPPPPANVAPTISSATANGSNMSGTITVAAGSTLSLVVSFSGTPMPTATWTLGSQSTTGSTASLPAQNGTLTVTVTNSEGTATRTCNIAALGAP